MCIVLWPKPYMAADLNTMSHVCRPAHHLTCSSLKTLDDNNANTVKMQILASYFLVYWDKVNQFRLSIIYHYSCLDVVEFEKHIIFGCQIHGNISDTVFLFLLAHRSLSDFFEKSHEIFKIFRTILYWNIWEIVVTVIVIVVKLGQCPELFRGGGGYQHYTIKIIWRNQNQFLWISHKFKI